MTHSDQTQRRVALGILAVGFIFYLATIRPGQRAGDFAMYLQHAANLVEGRPYAETTYVQNPDALSVGTTFYPPGVAIVAAPLYAVSGLELMPMKVLMVICFFVALLIFGFTVERRLAWPFLALMLFDLVFTPYFWDFKERVESDFLFLVPTFGTLLLIDRLAAGDGAGGRRRSVLLVLIGLVAYLAIATRTVGIALIPALLLVDWSTRRKILPSRAFWIPTLVVAGLVLLQGLILPSDDATYVEAFAERMSSAGAIVASLVQNLKYYLLAVTGRTLMSNGHGTLWADAMLLLSLAPFAVGFWTSIRHRFGVLEAFTIVYAAVLIVWPFRQPNYLIPLVPLLAFYLFQGLDHVAGDWPPKRRLILAGAALTLLLATYVPNYTTQSFDRLPHDAMSPASMAFYEQLSEILPEDEGVLVRIPRELALFTGRTTTPPRHTSDNPLRYSPDEVELIFDHARQMGIEYVATGPRGFEFHQEILPLWNLVDEYEDRFETVWENGEWRLVRILDSDAESNSRAGF